MPTLSILHQSLVAAVDMSTFASVVDPIMNELIYPILGVLFGLAVLIFIYGALQLVLKGDDEDARGKGKMMIGWGSVGLVIMVSAWGIIYFISNTIRGN